MFFSRGSSRSNCIVEWSQKNPDKHWNSSDVLTTSTCNAPPSCRNVQMHGTDHNLRADDIAQKIPGCMDTSHGAKKGTFRSFSGLVERSRHTRNWTEEEANLLSIAWEGWWLWWPWCYQTYELMHNRYLLTEWLRTIYTIIQLWCEVIISTSAYLKCR